MSLIVDEERELKEDIVVVRQSARNVFLGQRSEKHGNRVRTRRTSCMASIYLLLCKINKLSRSMFIIFSVFADLAHTYSREQRERDRQRKVLYQVRRLTPPRNVCTCTWIATTKTNRSFLRLAIEAKVCFPCSLHMRGRERRISKRCPNWHWLSFSFYNLKFILCICNSIVKPWRMM